MAISGKEKYVELSAYILNWTDKAAQVQLTNEAETRWIPRVCLHYSDDKIIDDTDDGVLRSQTWKIRVVKWFCTKNGLE